MTPKFFIGLISFQQLCCLICYFVIVNHNKNGQTINSLKFYSECIIFLSYHLSDLLSIIFQNVPRRLPKPPKRLAKKSPKFLQIS